MKRDESKRLLQGRYVVLLTKHSKETVIQPLLERETGCRLIVTSAFDTDRLGTFTGEIKRRRSQLKTALKKIRLGMKIADADIGVASEGSFGMHPYLSIPWNIEMVVLYDKKNKLVVQGIAESADTNLGHMVTDCCDEALSFAQRAGFPEHRVIARPDSASSRKMIKGIDTEASLRDAFAWAKTQSRTGRVFLETDMRAFANPTRMKLIGKATQTLITNLCMICPKCKSPGFAVTESVKGLPCERCKSPSALILKYVHRCQKCGYTEIEMYPHGHFAPNAYCEECNP